MISPIINFVTNPTVGNLVQNSVFQVVSEGVLKTTARPIFTLNDKTVPEKDRNYSAMQQFLYLGLCTLLYFAMVTPYKQAAYKVLKKIYKTKEGFEQPTLKAFEKAKSSVQKAINEAKLTNEPIPKQTDYTQAKGAMEAASILGSGVIMTIIAPQIVRFTMHPIAKYLEPKLKKMNTKA